MSIKTSHTFSSYPEFGHLTLEDRDAYNAIVEDFPPIYDISFTGLMTWWNTLDSIKVSTLNDNLIVSYWYPGEERHSGLSLIGTNDIDESLVTIFDHLKRQGEPVRLVNVPEFVIANIKYHDMFTFKEERLYSEYIYPISRFYPLNNMSVFWRKKIQRRKKDIDDGRIIVRSLDLESESDANLLLAAVDEWQSKGMNDYGSTEREAIRECIHNAYPLKIQNMCLFVNGQLHGFCLYEFPTDRRYAIVKHIKATHGTSLGFELMGYMFAKHFSEQGVAYINLNADFGKMSLRMFMLALGPSNFFRKYTIEPAKLG